MFAEVLVKANFSDPLTYSIPAKLYTKAGPGSLVIVPFGQLKKFGIITNLSKKRPAISNKIKPVQNVLANNWATPELISLAKKLSSSTGQPTALILFKLTPPPLKRLDLAFPSIKTKARKSTYSIYNSPLLRAKSYWSLVKKATDQGFQSLICCPQDQFPLISKELSGFKLITVTSNQSPTDQIKAYRSFRQGEIQVVLGSRKIIGWPAKQLGLIIIDNPLSPAHRDDQKPYLDTTTIAWQRQKVENLTLVLGANIPTLGLVQHEKSGLIKRIISGRAKPQIKLVKLTRGLLASEVLKEIKTKKTLIVAPRSGFGGTLNCLDCGWSLTCPTCHSDVNLNQSEKNFTCLDCSYKSTPPAQCLKCSGHNLRSFGIGVEAIRNELLSLGIRNVKVGTEKDLSGSFELIVWSFADSTLLSPDLLRPIGLISKIREFAYSTSTIVQTLNLENSYWRLLTNETFLGQLLNMRFQKGLPPFKRLFKIKSPPKEIDQLKESLSKIDSVEIVKENLVDSHVMIEALLDPDKATAVISALSKLKGTSARVDSIINYSDRPTNWRVNARRTYHRSLYPH